MSADPLGAVSTPKREAARAALAAVFGAAPLDRFEPISGGASGAAIFRVEAGGRTCLLRVEGTPSPLRNPHQYISLRLAAGAGIAPEIFHLDEAAGVAVMDFIAHRPLRDYPGGPRALAQALGHLLRKLQETSAFPYFVDYPGIVARLFAHVGRTGLFVPGLLDAHTERLARITESLSWDGAALVSAHNDLNARNILFDGERLWLIDWESAYRNDPLVDAAILLDNLAPAPDLEDVLLQAWLGRAGDETLRTRLQPIRALTRLYYAGVLLSASATLPRAAPDADLSAPTRAEFLSAVRDGRLQPGTAETIHTLGKVYLAAFLSGDPVPALDSV